MTELWIPPNDLYRLAKGERLHSRDMAYSEWHRTLPEWMMMMDIDALEYRRGVEGVSLWEVKRENEPLTSSQESALMNLGGRAGMVAYIVRHNIEIDDVRANRFDKIRFVVERLTPPRRTRKFNDLQFRLFLRNHQVEERS